MSWSSINSVLSQLFPSLDLYAPDASMRDLAPYFWSSLSRGHMRFRARITAFESHVLERLQKYRPRVCHTVDDQDSYDCLCGVSQGKATFVPGTPHTAHRSHKNLSWSSVTDVN